MLKPTKPRSANLAPIILVLTMGLNGCGEKSMTIPNSRVYSFDHKLPKSFYKNRDLNSEALGPFMDNGILFRGGAIGDPKTNTFDIGLQFQSETEGRKIFVEKLHLDTPNLKTDRVINDFIEINKFNKSSSLYWKRLLPFENIDGDSIPLTADSFTLIIDYRHDDGPTKQMSIKFENTTFLAPVL